MARSSSQQAADLSGAAPLSDLAPADGRILIGLNAVMLAVTADTPQVLCVRPPEGHRARFGRAYGLPYGPFDPSRHRTFEIGLRSWVEEQTYLQLGYVEQLYTFGDKGREAPIAALGGEADQTARVVSVGYLALTPHAEDVAAPGARWRDWYRFFPWENWRAGEPAVIADAIAPALDRWAGAGHTRGERWARAKTCFALEGAGWDEEKVLNRYELLYEAGLVEEARRDLGGAAAGPVAETPLGEPMISDHRRILATAIGRLRGKLKYRPVVFELLPATFTLFQLQRTVEAISGFRLHKQNFRRTVQRTGLVERTDMMSTETGGRPAAEYRFRREAVAEYAGAGLHIPRLRAGGADASAAT